MSETMGESDRTVTGVTAAELGLDVLFDVMRDAALVADVRTERIVFWNDAAAELFGFTAGETGGLPLEVLVPPELREAHHAGIRTYRATGHGPLFDSNQLVQLPALRKSGERIEIELRLTALPHAGGRSLVVATIRDVTERARSADELARANMDMQLLLDEEKDSNAQLRRVVDLKNDVVNMLAHDFRAPITAIAGFAELLRDSGQRLNGAQRTQALNSIINGARRLDHLVNDLLDTAGLESGTLRYHVGLFDLGAILTSAIHELAGVFGPDRFRLELPESPPRAQGDAGRYLQVAVNILSNAAKFSPPSEPVAVNVTYEEDVFTVCITDRGPGIAPEDQQRLFEKFVRLETPGVRAVPGTGLGLYIARQLVEDQGGHIWVESQPGQGASFCYTVPVCASAGEETV